MRWCKLTSVAAALALAGCSGTPNPGGSAADLQRLHAESFGPAKRRDVRTLVVVLHGNMPEGQQPYHYNFARTAAEAIPGARVIALLRPGYGDANGRRSPGNRGLGNGDGYDRARINAVADAIDAERQRYPGTRTILVGHAGGAVLAADVAGLRPEVVDDIVLVSCPCMLPEWRSMMEKRTPEEPFEAPVTSLDPLQTVGGIRPGVRATVLVGSTDEVTPPKLSRAYAEALALRGIATDFRVLPARGHELLDDPEVVAATARLAGSQMAAR